MSEAAVLSGVPFFGEVLDAAQVKTLAAKTHERLYRSGAVLMEEGEFGTSMLVLTEGRVRVSIDDGRGGRRDVADLGAGDIVGEMSLMTGARRTATVTALTEVAGLEITKVALESVIARSPELLDRFCAMLERRKGELAKAHADNKAWHILGMSAAQISAEVRRFFESVFGHRS
jgi:CRP-like cAMP-binding protein